MAAGGADALVAAGWTPGAYDKLEPEQRAWLERAIVDYPFFCRHLQIRLKGDLTATDEDEGRMGPFLWNRAQKIVWLWMVRQMERGEPIRLIILKARQFGISTFFCAWLFWWCWRKTAIRALIATQAKGTTSVALFETMNRFFGSLPEGFRPALRARGADRVSKEELYFADRESGAYGVFADKPDTARGDAVDMAFCTEVSSYRVPDEFFGAFTPAMGRRRDTTLVLESTAQPGYFWDRYRAGKRFNQSIFLPWCVVPELYSRPLFKDKQGRRSVWRDKVTEEIVTFTPSERTEQAFLTRQNLHINEIIGVELLGPVTEEQMAWRQRVIDEEYDGDTEWFDQEYPRDDVSCFEKSVRSAFKVVLPIVRATCEQVQTEPEFEDMSTGNLRCTDLEDTMLDEHVVEYVDEDPDFERHAGAIFFRWPVRGYTYTIGVDVADDLENSSDDDEDAMFSVISVYCCNTRDQVAEWRGSMDPHELGDVVAMFGYFYNTGMVNVEYNNMGVTTIDRLVKYLEYPVRFKWPKWDEAGKLTKKEMWWTDSKTKQLLIGNFRHAIKTGKYIVRSDGLREELASYRIEGGHYRAQRGQTADRIIAAALAWACVEQTDYGLAEVLSGGDDRLAEKALGQAQRAISTAAAGRPPSPGRRLPVDLDEDETIDVGSVEDLWSMAAF